MPLRALHFRDADGRAGIGKQACECFRVSLIGMAGAGERPPVHGDVDCPIGFAHMPADSVVAVNDHPQRRCLYASDTHVGTYEDTVGACGVHADQPVGFGPQIRRIGKSLIVAGGLHRVEGMADGVPFKAWRPQSHDRMIGMGVRDDAAESSSCPRNPLPPRSAAAYLEGKGH